MNKYFKKFSIIFVMLLAIVGIVTIQNESVVSAATVGQQLLQPEGGWSRYNYDRKEITYNGKNWWYDSTWAHNYLQGYNTSGAKIKFNFTGTKLRILTSYWSTYTKDADIIIDGKSAEKYVVYNNGKETVAPILIYEKTGLADREHRVEIINNTTDYLPINSIDIDANGILKPYNEDVSKESITLDKSSIDLSVGDLDKLTATTTPAALNVGWSSSNTSVATVDQNGNVTAVGEGTCVITATIKDGSNLSDSCTVNVKKKDTTEPTTPTEPDNTKALLIINLTDGETKIFDVSYSEVSKFKQWYNTKLEFENKLTYEFNKTVNSSISVEEDVVHDQITSYEIRKY